MEEENFSLFAKSKKRKQISLKPKADTKSRDSNPPKSDAELRNDGEASTSNISFKALGLTDWLCNVCKSLGMVRPTPVQESCIPAILSGRDVIGLASTGSGKTAAFALPILMELAKDPYGVFALIMTPTRELAIQIAEQFRALGAGMSLRDSVVIGGVDMQQQARDLVKRPHVIIATPGRLKGLLDADSGLKTIFTKARFLVLDEADRLMEPSFSEELRTILSALPGASSAPGGATDVGDASSGGTTAAATASTSVRQTLLFSATMTKSLIKLQSASMKDAFVYQAYEGLRTADRLKEEYIFIPAKVKEVYLAHVLGQLQDLKVRSAIIFSSTCKGCHLLSLVLEELGLSCASLHSGKPQKQRIAALSKFKSGMVPLLLATDVASRGLDIPTVDLVINYDLPMLASDYVHRVGRTARAGRSGWSLSFITQHDIQLLHKIEELVGHQLSEFKVEEAEALKGITKVYGAKRAAMLKVAEEDGLDTSDRRVKKMVKRMR
ncbi:hypothetical protein CEUSTIGMA_g13691.t1 [Chlamydomonas eustigma]|uniref:RNA helicase n=1 Tax=Chlamydomonas eustigma TaxID=1157962 RepID=A0A250XTI9_9CHLO|nr:hypothetical protein CEUSTIGMA_g13691.t1 [Chlamydomonas eustigma]|eukprot:GAX86279.1 hypothetical protein CEUSTIGMA_g13691.t1 [Chlamydomonas eustigma]